MTMFSDEMRHKCQIVNKGDKTEIWLDGERISDSIDAFCLSQCGDNEPILELQYTKSFRIGKLEIELDSDNILKRTV